MSFVLGLELLGGHEDEWGRVGGSRGAKWLYVERERDGIATS